MGNEKGGGAVRCIQNFNFIHVPLDFILLFQLLILLISKSGMEQLFYNPFFFVCKLKKIFAVRKRWEGGGIPLPTLRCFVPLPDKLEEIGWSHLIGFPEFRSWHHVLEKLSVCKLSLSLPDLALVFEHLCKWPRGFDGCGHF